MTTTPSLRRTLDDRLRDLAYARRARAEAEKEVGEARDALQHALAAQALLQEAAEQAQQLAHRQIAAVASRCLEVVFGPGAYELGIDFVPRRGKTEAEFVFRRKDTGLTCWPEDGVGGGVIDVASFGLRLACLVLEQPQRRRLVCLDEPFRYVSRNLRPTVRALLQTLANEMGLQIIMVTHMQDLVMGNVIEIGR